MNQLEELKQLRKELTRHDYRYYVLFNNTISDQEYDRMYKRYTELLIETIGPDTRSLEAGDLYPQWVRDELGTIPIT